MDPNTLLAQLRDVHKPDPISWWPLAPGWWFLIILMLVVISLCSYFIYTKWQSGKWRRQALKHLSDLENVYEESPSPDVLLDLNRLLKQSLSSSKEDRRFLNMCGNDWATVLNKVSKKNKPILSDVDIRLLSNTIYSSEAASIKLDAQAFSRFRLWIKQID